MNQAGVLGSAKLVPSLSCWPGDSGATAQDIAAPLGRNNTPPEQLFRQGAEFRWMPEPDVMELPDAATLYPVV
eukprot:1141400-Pelagomonas_calceolata.AAC.2